MDFGTACHETIELLKTREKVPGVDIDVAIFLFRKKLEFLFGTNSSFYPKRDLIFDERTYSSPIDPLLSAGENIIRRLDECDEIRESEVVYNEFPLYEKIDRTDDLDVKFKGFIDLVVKTKDKRGNTILYVCDFKTCSFGWDRDKRQDQSLHFQLLLYKHFLCKKFGLDPKLVRTAFVLLKKRPPPVEKGSKETVCPVEWFPISAGPVATQRAVDYLNTTVTKMSELSRTDDLRKMRDKCLSDFGDLCVYYNTNECPGKNDDVEAKLAERREKDAAKKNRGGKSLVDKTSDLRSKLFGGV